jgi:hypothetical protein
VNGLGFLKSLPENGIDIVVPCSSKPPISYKILVVLNILVICFIYAHNTESRHPKERFSIQVIHLSTLAITITSRHIPLWSGSRITCYMLRQRQTVFVEVPCLQNIVSSCTRSV